MSKHYQGPPPFYVSRIYGRRLLAARQVRGKSRNWLGEKCNLEAWRIRAIERVEVAVVDDPLMIERLSFLLGFPLAWFHSKPLPEDAFDAKGIFLCESLERVTCSGCGEGNATLLCDRPEAGGRTCDAPICAACTHRLKSGDDRCPAHGNVGRRRVAKGETSQDRKGETK